VSADRPGPDDATPAAPDGHGDNRPVRPDHANEAHGQGRAETRTREEYAEAMRRSTAGGRDQGAVTHFHAEFKGHPLDLYTDGTRWAAAGTPRQEETVSGKGELPDQPPDGEDPPEGGSLLERLRREVYQESEDELDQLESDANLVHDVFDRPPAGSYQGTAPDQPVIHGAQHSGIDAGSAATAVFTLGLVIDRGIRWAVQHYEDRVKGS